jgi:hypothetical protein
MEDMNGYDRERLHTALKDAEIAAPAGTVAARPVSASKDRLYCRMAR